MTGPLCWLCCCGSEWDYQKEHQGDQIRGARLRKLPRATTNVQKNKSYVGLFISYVGLFISYVGLFISYVGLFISYVGLFISYVGLYKSYVGDKKSYVGDKKSYVGV